MSLSLLLACLGLVVLVEAGVVKDLPETRIINGHEIDIKDAPWQVALLINDTHWCGGSIISTRWVLTAAHCASTKQIPHLTIRIGSTHKKQGGAVYKVEDVVNHQDYIQRKTSDISVWKTKEEMVLVHPVRPVRLASQRPPVNTKVTVTGWGWMEDNTYPDLLRAVDIVITDFKECLVYNGRCPDTEICAGLPGKGPFSADSGGPLVCGDLQVGVVSGGSNETSAQIPGIYTDVAYFRNWIRERTGV